MILNNIKLKYKLLFVYIFCVFFPIIIINIIFYNDVVENVTEIQNTYYKLSTQSIASYIEGDLNQVMSIITRISIDHRFYEMLERNYEEGLDYVTAYYDFFNPYLYLNVESYQQINRVLIFTDNENILNSGSIRKIDNDIRKENWYKTIINMPGKVHIEYGETDLRRNGTFLTEISFYKLLNQFDTEADTIKIVRIDILRENILNIINRERIKGNIYIINGEKEIIFADNYDIARENLKTLINNEPDAVQREIGGNIDWTVVNIIDVEDLEDALKSPRNKVISLTLISLIIATLIITLISRSYYTRINELSIHLGSLDKSGFTKFYPGVKSKDEIGKLIISFNKMISKIKTLITDVYEAEIEHTQIELEKKQAEVNALQSQMNPHFLFNTLESIRMKSLEKNEVETAKIIKYLARSFRRIISYKKEWINVAEELDYIKDFLKIQKYRFESEFEYKLEIASETLSFKIPKLVIQPFVENACIHGIGGIEDIGQLYLKTELVEGNLKCIIKDNGIGIKKDKLELIHDILKLKEDSYNIGIQNVYKRLELYYGKRFSLKIESEEGKGTCIILIIPGEVKHV